nr:MAG TPA: hypothetical protein [Caudoviricetes sp.]
MTKSTLLFILFNLITNTNVTIYNTTLLYLLKYFLYRIAII